MWTCRNNPYQTLGFEGLKTEVGTNVVNMTEKSVNSSACLACIESGRRDEDGSFQASEV